MSYDFELFRKRNNEDRITAGKTNPAEQQRDAGVISGGKLPDISKDQLKRHLADILTSKHPAFQEFQKDYKRIAQAKSITEAEARERYGYIELTDVAGLQVTLFDDTAAVTMAFWPEPENRLRTAWDCLKILESHGKFSTYDRQIGRNLNLESDFEVVRAAYVGANRVVDQRLRKRT